MINKKKAVQVKLWCFRNLCII